MKAPKADQETFERCEKEGIYKDGKYKEEYVQALQSVYQPITISVPVPRYLRDVFGSLSWDVYHAMWGRESEFKITGNLKSLDLRRRLREIQAPVLIIASDSGLIPFEYAKRDAENIRNSKLVLIENAKHFIFLDQPKQFEQVVKEFLVEKK